MSSHSANEAPTRPNSEVHERPSRVRRSSGFEVFVSFDSEHDGELCDRIMAESRVPGAGFTVLGSSSRSPETEASRDLTRRRIERADQVIVLCGEHTDESLGVFRELRDTQNAEKPYVMLWGRRDVMCSKPQGARPAEGMFSWTPQILQEQLALNQRRVIENEKTAAVARRFALLKGRPVDREAPPPRET